MIESFCSRFRERLDQAEINTKQKHDSQNSSAASKLLQYIWPEIDKMNAINTKNKKVYVTLTKHALIFTRKCREHIVSILKIK